MDNQNSALEDNTDKETQADLTQTDHESNAIVKRKSENEKAHTGIIAKSDDQALSQSVNELSEVLQADIEIRKSEQKHRSKGLMKRIGRHTSQRFVIDQTTRHWGTEYRNEGLRFLKNIQGDIEHINAVGIEAKNHKWLEEMRVPFRMTMRELGVFPDELEKKLHGLLMAHAICAVSLIYSLYLFISSLVAVIMGEGAILYMVNMVALVIIFSVLWMMYGYHCWTFRNDRYGSFRHFLFDMRHGATAIFFPYHASCQEHHSDSNFSEFFVIDEDNDF
ncbi:hypothetical protein [Photobacterium leiognathi]|uniref:hypothetical protein n=1 Tax=Photobacterium leiognathi TaxID=553611 RepID=UPI002981F94E|nr:hypothetical protein [Photobacterium leiognathi]